MTNDDARDIFEKSSMTYKDITKENLERLRDIINIEMIESGNFDNTFRCNDKVELIITGNRFFAGLTCRSHYFNDREAVSFNCDGFVGFAGWASTDNVQPILKGFERWVSEVAP
jgi:hypothetical protein